MKRLLVLQAPSNLAVSELTLTIFWVLVGVLFIVVSIWLVDRKFGPRPESNPYEKPLKKGEHQHVFEWEANYAQCKEIGVCACGERREHELHDWVESEYDLNDNDGGTYGKSLMKTCRRCNRKKYQGDPLYDSPYW